MVSEHSLRRALLALTLTLATAAPASAKDLAEITAAEKETARQLLDAGDALFTKGDLAGALGKYRAADGIMGVPTTAIEVGKVLEKMGRLVEARDAYLRVLRYPQQADEPAVFVEARTDADAKAASLQPRIPSLTLFVTLPNGAPEPVVTVDGKKVSAAILGQPLSVDPGRHEVTVTAEGFLPGRAEVTVAEGGSESVTLQLQVDPNAPAPSTPLPATPPPVGAPPPGTPPAKAPEAGFPVFATVGFSIGAAGLILGGVTGGLSLAKTGDLADACSDDKRCGPDQQGTIDDAKLLANLSNVGFAVGGAGVLFGVIALFTLDAPPSEPTVDAAGIQLTPIIGPTGAGLIGRF